MKGDYINPKWSMNFPNCLKNVSDCVCVCEFALSHLVASNKLMRRFRLAVPVCVCVCVVFSSFLL